MSKKRCIAMLLAGGNGSRLGIMTEKLAKPAMFYGGKYRIVDFTLSNCANSGIDTVGVLTQYEAHSLHEYIGDGAPWRFCEQGRGAYMLPSSRTGREYSGTANAVLQNTTFIDSFDPDYVLILSGDHVYKMDYRPMIDLHMASNADITIAGTEVPHAEAHRFGIMQADAHGRLTGFEEKPPKPKSTMASMGVYVFTWKALRELLMADDSDHASKHDFGRNIIPHMLASGRSMFVHRYDGYWRDVGTVQSYWESNMDLLADTPMFNLFDPTWRVYGSNRFHMPNYVGGCARITSSILSDGCSVYGEMSRSILSAGALVQEGAVVRDSILMPGAVVMKGAQVRKAIVCPYAIIGEHANVGVTPARIGAHSVNGDITLIGEGARVLPGHHVECGAVIGSDRRMVAS